MDESMRRQLAGFWATFLSFLAWGMLCVYWSKMFRLPFFTITAYRVVWSFIFVAFLITVTGKWGAVRNIFKDKRSVGFLMLCGLLIGCNWTLYMLTIASGKVMQTSMGYYMNPIMNALIGVVLFKEYLRRMQKVAIGVVAVGVLYMVVAYGSFPVYAFFIALSFALYGAAHKQVSVKVLDGMFYELVVLLLPALAVLFLSPAADFFAEPLSFKMMLMISGPFTALPLLGFAFGVQRLQYVTVGIVQYISPTATLVLSIFYFKEDFNKDMAIVFAFIWLGIIVYIADAVLYKRMKPALSKRKSS